MNDSGHINKIFPELTPDRIRNLEERGCTAEDWSKVKIHPGSDLALFRNVEFEGDVTIGLISRDRSARCAVRDILLRDCTVGDGVRLRHVPGGISNAVIGNDVEIENCASISFTPGSHCGVGCRVAVLDETGSREVIIYPGLSSQAAMVMARAKRAEAEKIYSLVDSRIDSGELRVNPASGERAKIINCGPITDVAVGHDVTIDSALSLRDGAILNNAPGKSAGLTYVGPGTDAENFIIEDGKVSAGALLRNVYVGQGAVIEKGFTAHDSLFFANCAMENGEACALFAGPFSVSMHKGTLLIGCQTSFMNAGSSTNQSNHMYKLGPVHWGVLERGVKTSSGSYLMLGANIGAFSLLMGHHKTHPDSREFPFSYLFGDAQGATVVVPGVMLRSCGLLRDEKKWPARDRRDMIEGLPHYDRIVCSVLNPVTVDAMINALDIIRPMLSRPADDDRYHRYKGMKLSRASLERAMKLYYLGIMKYLSGFINPDGKYSENSAGGANPNLFSPLAEGETSHPESCGEWIDISGLPMPREKLKSALECDSLREMDNIFDDCLANYVEYQKEWIDRRFPAHLRLSAEEIRRGAEEFDRLVELDRETYRESLSSEAAMLRL